MTTASSSCGTVDCMFDPSDESASPSYSFVLPHYISTKPTSTVNNIAVYFFTLSVIAVILLKYFQASLWGLYPLNKEDYNPHTIGMSI